MRVLLLAHYFPPDLSACAFRMRGFLPALEAQLGEGAHIDLLTTAPHRYASFVSSVPEEEVVGRTKVRRIRTPSHKSGMIDQSRAFGVYSAHVLKAVRGRKYDLVFATSSRLMTAVLGTAVARLVKAPLYLDLRDIFAENMQELLSPVAARMSGPFFRAMEGFAIRGASRVNLVSEGFREYFEPRYPETSFSYIPNGIDPEFSDADWSMPIDGGDGKTRIVYAGNIGDGQGLHHIVPELASALRDTAHFRIIGDGGRRSALEVALSELGLANVEILDPMPREMLLQEYREADLLFLHLNDLAAFRKVLPSKIFEYAATGRPIWAGVGGFAATFLKNQVPGASVFRPCDAADALRQWQRISFSDWDREDFKSRYSRKATSSALAQDVRGLLDGFDD